MTAPEAAILVSSSLLAGALNSVAGGGSFFTVPALIAVQVPPVSANTTSTTALWPGSVAGVLAYRKELAAQHQLVLPMCFASIVGGLAGSFLLLKTSDKAFLLLLPWLLLGATCLFSLGPKITAALKARRAETGRSGGILLGVVLQLLVATYGGYFGGGIGILMLALLSVMGLENIHEMNALKTFLACLINGVSAFVFVFSGKVMWLPFGVMVVGAIVGGYIGARTARKLPQITVRRFVISAGFAMSAALFWKSLGG